MDVAIIAAWDRPPVPPDHVRLHPLLIDPMVVVLPDDHELARDGSASAIDLGRLRDEAWVTIRAGHAARAQFDRAAPRRGSCPGCVRDRIL